MCYVGLVYPRPRFGLLSRGEAVRDEPAQYISMRLRKRPWSFLIGESLYRDSQYWATVQKAAVQLSTCKHTLQDTGSARPMFLPSMQTLNRFIMIMHRRYTGERDKPEQRTWKTQSRRQEHERVRVREVCHRTSRRERDVYESQQVGSQPFHHEHSWTSVSADLFTPQWLCIPTPSRV